MRRLPQKLLEEHGAFVLDRDGTPEPAWRQVLRLNQSLWRQEQGLAPKVTRLGFLGSSLSPDHAATGANLMSDAGREAAAGEVEAALGAKARGLPGKVVDAERLYVNLLGSQTLCFSIFAELRADLEVASHVISRLLGKPVEVTGIELEHNPGRGDPSYTGDRSAADAFIEYTHDSRQGFLCIETKYFEDLLPSKDSKDSFRPRYSEVAAQMGCFKEGAEPTLRRPPLEQLWRDHLLAGAILLHPGEPYDEGFFVLVHPGLNEACALAAKDYLACLSNDNTFQVWTLEAVIEALLEEANCDWAWTLQDRYLDFYRVDHAYQDHYVQQTKAWAEIVKIDLGHIQAREGHRVWFRPSSSGFAMVGLLPEKPQLGTSYDGAAKVRENFETEFAAHCDGSEPRRVTPEKALQSFLVSSGLTNSRRLDALDKDLTFLTDELVIPSIYGDQRLDILASRSVRSWWND